MKLLPTLTTAIASTLTLSACASRPSMPSTAPVLLPPLECVQRCPPPPPLTLRRNLWEVETLQWGFACRALHNDCAEALTSEQK